MNLLYSRYFQCIHERVHRVKYWNSAFYILVRCLLFLVGLICRGADVFEDQHELYVYAKQYSWCTPFSARFSENEKEVRCGYERK